MNILSLENVSKNYGIKPLFENVTVGFEEREKIGIIGANGSGKTTLLQVIAGKETPDTGRVVGERENGNLSFAKSRVCRRSDRSGNRFCGFGRRDETYPRL